MPFALFLSSKGLDSKQTSGMVKKRARAGLDTVTIAFANPQAVLEQTLIVRNHPETLRAGLLFTGYGQCDAERVRELLEDPVTLN